jgi:hypothetical protein
MKKLLLLFFLIIGITVNAQIGSDAPWMESLENERITSPTLEQVSSSFDTYWEHRDKDKKGSGYKPYKRWENFWSTQLDENGHLMTREAIWQAWEQKQAMRQNTTQRSATLATSNWTSIGPYAHDNSSSWSPGQGRVNYVTVDPNDSNTYYVGAPAGGIWKSTDAGASWTPLSDNLPQIGVSGIAVDPNNSSIIYIATGDDDSWDSYSLGVLKSTDGGTTWNTTGLSFSNSSTRSNDIFINSNDSNMLWVATNNGVYKTTDAGATWTNKLSGNVKDLKVKPNDYSTLYAVKNNAFYKSTDFGETFTAVTTAGMPASTRRMAIAVTPANANVVYLLNAYNNGTQSYAFEGVYKSTDSGANFAKTLQTTDIFDGSGQAYYDMAITVSNTNENTLFVGVLNIWKSTNGGDAFAAINDWSTPSGAAYTHADIHFLRYYNGVLFAGTDGGVYRSTDDGASFTDLTVNGLAIGQFYRVSVSKNSSNNVVGGLQDNGGFGYSGNSWYNYHGADGMDCAVDPTNDNTYYGFTQNGGGLQVSHNAGVTGSNLASKPTGATGNWITPLVVNNQGTVYAGYDKLYKLDGTTFVATSGADFGGNIKNIEIDPQNSLTIFVSNGTSIYKSTNGGVTFTNLHSFSAIISSIEVNNMNSNIIYVSTNGASGKIHKSTDGGTTWTDITYNLPNDSKNVIRHQNHHSDNPLYVGTSLGVFYMDDLSGNTWQVFDTNLPNVSVRDLEINIYDHKITAATYGRGVWQSPISSQVPTDEIEALQVSEPVNVISCNNAIAPVIKVKNAGTNSISQIDISYSYDNGAVQNYQWNGTLTSSSTIDITIPSTTLTVAPHTLKTVVTIANDAYPDNNTVTSSFIVNDSSSPDYLFTFEDAAIDTLVTEGTAWEIETPASTSLNSVSSGTKAYCIGPNANYPANTTAYLYSRCYDLTTITTPVLTFQMAFRIELDWDVLYMQYSLDGANWQLLGTAADPNWYNSTSSTHALTIGNQWTGLADTMQAYSYDLAAFTNETSIQFRFFFGSDGAVEEEGVVIDDFVINGTMLSVGNTLENSLFIHPNPSNGVFKISWNNGLTAIKSMQIYTISGKLIKTINQDFSGLNNYELDLNNLSKGLYLLKIQSDKTQVTKKLILK